MKYYIIITVSSLFVSCNNIKNEEKSNSVNSASVFREKLYDKKLIDSLNHLVLDKGDTIAYNELKVIHYIGEQKFTGFLFYALVMSNKFNYKKASFDVYDILNSETSTLDVKTKKMADEYLLKSK
ncbi:MAG: hypothetical protein QM710_05895 [Flavobacterium sp.]